MLHKEYLQFTDQELLEEAKKMKSFSITNALLIGFLVGITFYSIVKNSWGMLTIIPLFFIYKMVNDPKNKSKRITKDIKRTKLEITNYRRFKTFDGSFVV